MIPENVERLLTCQDNGAKDILYDDKGSFFWVDWREEDDSIASYCEEILETGELTSEFVDINTDPFLNYTLSTKGFVKKYLWS